MLSPISFIANNSLRELNAGSTVAEQQGLEQNTIRRTVSELEPTGADQENLEEKISQAIDESLIHKIFSAIARTQQGTFASYGESLSDNSIDGFINHQLSGSEESGSAHSHSQSLQLDLANNEPSTVNITAEQIIQNTNRQANSLSVSIVNEDRPPQSDPLILDLDFNGFQLSATHNNVQFDLNADGKSDSISNTEGKDAFLALDINKNGIIDNGSELFGDTRGAKDGFADLARFDDNSDSLINAQDRIYNQLLLLTFDSNGRQSFSSLKDAGITSLSLSDSQINQDLANGNTLVSQATFTTDSGQQGLIGDFLLATR